MTIVLQYKLFVLSATQLVVTHIVLQLLDLVTTLFVILHTSTSLEVNPVIRFILNTPGGMWWLTALKLVMCGILWWMIPKSLEDSPSYAWVWRGMAIFYLIVVLNNLVAVTMILISH